MAPAAVRGNGAAIVGSSAWKWPLGVALWFAGLSWWMAAPLGGLMTRGLVYYGSPGDAMFGIVNIWTQKQAWLADRAVWIWGLEPMLEMSVLALSLLTHELFAYNALLWLSFPLAGLTMYLLCWSVTRHRAASLLAGLAYAYCPYHFAHTTQLSLASIQWLPLVPWSLWRWGQQPTRRRWLLCAGLSAWASAWNPHYGLFTLLLIGLLGFGVARRNPSRRPGWAGLLAAIALVNLAVLWSGLRPGGVHAATLVWDVKDLFVYSAKPWDYLVPSIYHPWWGEWFAAFTRAHWYGSNVVEQTLFLGYSVLALAAIGLWRGARTPEDTRVVRWIAIAGAAALLCSAPPFVPIGAFQIVDDQIIARWKWLFPSALLHQVLPWLRVYARFGILVMLAAAVLAAFGARAVLQRIPAPRARQAAAAALGALILVEFLGGLQSRDLSQPPPVYAWLAEQPGDAPIVEYPWRRSDTDIHAEYMFWWRVHRKPLLNAQADEAARRELADPVRPDAARRLAALGIRYAIVHPAAYTRSITAAPRDITVLGVTYPVVNRHAWEPAVPPDRPDGWREAVRFDDAVVYEVARRA